MSDATLREGGGMTPIPKPAKRPSEPRKPLSRQKRPRRARKGNLAALKRTADRLWSQLVRSRPGGCECCGRTDGVFQGAHGFSRRYLGTRWNPLNGFKLSQGCHVRWTFDPIRWTDFLRAAWGSPVYEEMERLARLTYQPTIEEMQETIAKLQSELNKPSILGKMFDVWQP
jgi:hypothetical protein